MTPILVFVEGYVPRMWGGTRLRDVYDKPTPIDVPIGEAWLVADHAEHESVVADGPHAGRTLRNLLQENARAVLGRRAQLTVHGRFPLLLKLLDAGDKLSIQVHPDDAGAKRLGEPDIGKTEMWYVIEGELESTLYCGTQPGTPAADFDHARRTGRLSDLLTQIHARPGTSVFVPAGTVHAIGGGCLLAEIQQNSDLTYRIDDWGRMQPDGSPRALHLDKAMQVIRFDSRHGGAAQPLAYEAAGACVRILAACRYFVAECVDIRGEFTVDTRGDSFQLLLGLSGRINVNAGDDARTLQPGQAMMVTGEVTRFSAEGPGTLLRYYVPDLQTDVVAPLLDAGHEGEAVVALGGEAPISDLAPLVEAARYD